MGTVTVNDIEVECGPKDNLILAARRAGVEIPHYCWHPDLSVVASCRMCLVEVGEKKPDGSIVMQPRLIPGCQTIAKPGTVVRTDSDKVKAAQAQTLEYLLLNHPLDCSICDQAGECYLQDYTYKFGKAHSRLNEPKVQRMDKYHIGEQIALFTDRCVMCTRCVRFTREVSGTSELHVVSRGSVEEIEVFPDQPCNNKLAGNVVDLCPVGALCSKDFLYKKRVWWLKSQDSVCNLCSTGCSIHADQNDNKLYRVRPRENPQAQGSFMCDEGRFGWKYIHSDDRLIGPRVGRIATAPSAATTTATATAGNGHAATSGNGHATIAGDMPTDLAQADPWPQAIAAARSALSEALTKDPQHLIVVLSPMMTTEEAYMLAKLVRGSSSSSAGRPTLALGPVPIIGEDDRYPKDYRGAAPAIEKTKFTIRAEKCPNRRGVEMVLKHFQGEVIGFDKVLERAERGDYTAAYFVGGYTWDRQPACGSDCEKVISDRIVSAFSKLSTLIVQDLLRSPLTDAATVLLAGTSFLEREGSFVNHAGLAQAIKPVLRPLGESRSDGRILFEVTGRTGVFNAAVIRREIADTISAFAALSGGQLDAEGTFVVKQPQPVTA